jgi:hypothetical protein
MSAWTWHKFKICAYHQDHQNRHHRHLGLLVHGMPWMTLLWEALCKCMSMYGSTIQLFSLEV